MDLDSLIQLNVSGCVISLVIASCCSSHSLLSNPTLHQDKNVESPKTLFPSHSKVTDCSQVFPKNKSIVKVSFKKVWFGFGMASLYLKFQ